jgi:hypothetical protein
VATSDVVEVITTLTNTIPPKFKVHEKEETILLLDKWKTLVEDKHEMVI